MTPKSKSPTLVGKPCVKCGSTERYKSQGQCAPCDRANAAKWRQNNRERQRDLLAKWRESNPERVKELRKDYYAANSEQAKAAAKAAREANPEVFKKRLVDWRMANPDKFRQYDANRRARKLASGGKLSRDLSERLFKLQKGKCACCREALKVGYHLDHIVPLARGGENHDRNTQLLCRSCNQSKHAKDPIDFMQSRGHLL